MQFCAELLKHITTALTMQCKKILNVEMMVDNNSNEIYLR